MEELRQCDEARLLCKERISTRAMFGVNKSESHCASKRRCVSCKIDLVFQKEKQRRAMEQRVFHVSAEQANMKDTW